MSSVTMSSLSPLVMHSGNWTRDYDSLEAFGAAYAVSQAMARSVEHPSGLPTFDGEVRWLAEMSAQVRAARTYYRNDLLAWPRAEAVRILKGAIIAMSRRALKMDIVQDDYARYQPFDSVGHQWFHRLGVRFSELSDGSPEAMRDAISADMEELCQLYHNTDWYWHGSAVVNAALDAYLGSTVA